MQIEELRERIYQAIGEASTCVDSAGIFDTERASEVAADLAKSVVKLIQSINTVARARETMRKAFEWDEDLKVAYVANIAMLLNDRYGITDYEERNRAAEDILKLMFWS